MAGKHRVQRHRHRAQNLRLRRAAGVVGVATAVGATGVLTAVNAHADPAWDPIIACESGGNAQAQNPSSTASGLFQFLDTSWRAYGGGQYAARAKDATVAQQYEVAGRAYAQSGLSPWAASRSCWSGKTGSLARPVMAATPSRPVTASISAPKHAAPESTAAPKHAAPELAQSQPSTSTAPTLPAYSGPTTEYVVAQDDTLTLIADIHQISGGWPQIVAANLDTIANPDVIQTGQHLKLPAAESPMVPLGLPQPVKFSSPQPEPKALAVPVPAAPAPVVKTESASGGIAARAVSAALGKRGVMYSAMDCSALVQYAYRAAGVTLPRIAADQATMGRPVSLNELRPGDILTFYRPVSHVAIFIGDGKIVESSLPGRPIAVRPMYLDGFVGARRIIG